MRLHGTFLSPAKAGSDNLIFDAYPALKCWATIKRPLTRTRSDCSPAQLYRENQPPLMIGLLGCKDDHLFRRALNRGLTKWQRVRSHVAPVVQLIFPVWAVGNS